MKKSKAVKGETLYDSSTRKVSKFINTPLPPKQYEGKVLPGSEIAKAAGKGKLPYVRAKIEVLNSAAKKGGKNRILYHNFFLNTSTDADGKASVDRQDGITAYSHAIGAKLKCPVIPAKKLPKDGGDLVNVKILDHDIAVKFLEKAAGRVFKMRTKNEPSLEATVPPTLWPKVDAFIDAEEESEDGEEEDEDEEGSEDEEDDDEDEESDEEESDDEDEDEDSEDDEDEDESDDEDEDDEDEEDDEEDDDEDEDESDDDEEEDEDEDEEPVKKKAKKAAKKPVKKKGKK